MNPVTVTANTHFLTRGSTEPFLLLADTAWELVHRLDLAEVRYYAETRAKQGFNSILFCLLAELDGLRTPNRGGDRPLIEDDPSRPNEAYFQFVDQVLDVLEMEGLVAGILPTWGDKWNRAQGQGPEIFTPENARRYGEWLGRRYDARSVFWVLGGDRRPQTPTHRAILQAMAEGICAGSSLKPTITFHPSGGQDGRADLCDPIWLDFAMHQSGHSHACMPNYFLIEKDYARKPTKPTLDAEPCYDGHPIMSANWEASEERHWDHHCRRALYWAIFSGACGHVYGAHSVWQFYDPERTLAVNHPHWSWREALHFPGASQMAYIHRLLPFDGDACWFPFQEVIAEQPPAQCAHIVSCRNADRTEVLFYTPDGNSLTLNFSVLAGGKYQARWWSPATGVDVGEAEIIETDTVLRPPIGGPDWVLRLSAV